MWNLHQVMEMRQDIADEFDLNVGDVVCVGNTALLMMGFVSEITHPEFGLEASVMRSLPAPSMSSKPIQKIIIRDQTAVYVNYGAAIPYQYENINSRQVRVSPVAHATQWPGAGNVDTKRKKGLPFTFSERSANGDPMEAIHGSEVLRRMGEPRGPVLSSIDFKLPTDYIDSDAPLVVQDGRFIHGSVLRKGDGTFTHVFRQTVFPRFKYSSDLYESEMMDKLNILEASYAPCAHRIEDVYLLDTGTGITVVVEMTDRFIAHSINRYRPWMLCLGTISKDPEGVNRVLETVTDGVVTGLTVEGSVTEHYVSHKPRTSNRSIGVVLHGTHV